MKKILLSIVGVLAAVIVGAYVFREPLIEIASEQLTSDMFVAEDADSFDPGLPVGAAFPSLNAVLVYAEGGNIPVTDASAFIFDKGMVFIANRSSDW